MPEIGFEQIEFTWSSHINPRSQGVFQEMLTNAPPQEWCQPTLRPVHSQSLHGTMRNVYTVILKHLF